METVRARDKANLRQVLPDSEWGGPGDCAMRYLEPVLSSFRSLACPASPMTTGTRTPKARNCHHGIHTPNMRYTRGASRLTIPVVRAAEPHGCSRPHLLKRSTGDFLATGHKYA
jgi:hypothetical protein